VESNLSILGIRWKVRRFVVRQLGMDLQDLQDLLLLMPPRDLSVT